MADLRALSDVLRQQGQAAGRVNTLQQQLAQAEALRGQRQPRIDPSSGYVSPFAILADVVGKSRGRQQVRELTPQLEQAQQQVAAGDTAEKMFTLQRAMEQEKYKQEQDRLARDARAREQEALSTYRTGMLTGQAESREDLKAHRAALIAERQADRQARIAEEESKTAKIARENSEKEAKEKAKAEQEAVKGFYGVAHTDKQMTQRMKTLAAMKHVVDKAEALSAEDVNQLNDPSDRFKQLIIKAAIPGSFGALASEELSGLSKPAKDFLVTISRLTAEERHALFGAALTKTETETSEEFIDRVRGLSYDAMIDRLASRHKGVLGDIRAMDVQHNGTRYTDTVKRAGYDAVFDNLAEERRAETEAVERQQGLSTSEKTRLQAIQAEKARLQAIIDRGGS